ncbi:MAG: (2S)-3-sulfopropanediol dehydratase activating enzyme, partial [Bacilli bacterium]
IRVPVIPGFNDDFDNIKATGAFIIKELGNKIEALQLLSFMRLGEEKYLSLGMPYQMEDLDFNREEFQVKINEFEGYLTSLGINCLVGTKVKEK